MDTPTDLLPLPPTPPADWECCGSECGDACIYVLYQKERERYEQQLRQLKNNHPSPKQ